MLIRTFAQGPFFQCDEEARIEANTAAATSALPVLEDLRQELLMTQNCLAEYKESGLEKDYELIRKQQSNLKRDIRNIKGDIQEEMETRGRGIKKLKEGLADANKALLKLSTSPETRRVYSELRRFCRTLPELVWEYPNLNPLFGTAAQNFPINSFEMDYTGIKPLDTGTTTGRHKLYSAMLKTGDRNNLDYQPRVLKQFVPSGVGNTKNCLKELIKAIEVNVFLTYLE